MAEQHFNLWTLVNPTPKQREFWRAVQKYSYILYGGARGGGKSYILRWTLIKLLVEWFLKWGQSNVRVGMFCEDYPTLKDRQITKIRVEFPDWLGKWNGEDKEFRLVKDLGAGVIAFRNLDDPSKYMSAEFAAMAVDQLEKNPVELFNVLRGSLRWTGIRDTKFLAAANPGGIGHLWVKSYFKDRELPPELRPRKDQFAYVQALPSDNPHLSPEYIEELNALPDKLRRAWMDGDWDVFEGQVFEEWREHLHVIENDFRIPPNWSWAAGLDFGHREYTWMGVFAAGGDGDVVCADEFTCKDIHAEEAGYQAGTRLLNHPPLEYVAGDEEMFWQTGIGPTKAEEFQRGLDRAMSGRAPRLIRITHGKGSRAGRLELFHRYLAWKEADDGQVPPWWQPKLKFMRRCRYAIKTIPALCYDTKKLEDVDTHGEDHAYDGVSYYLMSRPVIGEPIPTLPEADTHPGLDRSGHRRKRYIDAQLPGDEPTGYRVPRQYETLTEFL